MFVLVASKVLATTVPPTADETRPEGADGAVVSMTIALFPPKDDDPPVAGRVINALFPAVSRITPELSASAVVDE